MNKFSKQFIAIANALYPDSIKEINTQSEEMDRLIQNGNSAFEDWGIYKVVASFCIRSYENQFNTCLSPKPLANIAVREYLELALQEGTTHLEIRDRIEAILKGYRTETGD